jgi:hypothetical protein
MAKRKLQSGPKKLATIATYSSFCGAAPLTPNPAHKRIREADKAARAAAVAVKREAKEAKRLEKAPQKEAAAVARREAADAYKRGRAPVRTVVLESQMDK